MASFSRLPTELKIEIFELALAQNLNASVKAGRKRRYSIDKPILNLSKDLRGCAMKAMENHRDWLEVRLKKLELETTNREKEFNRVRYEVCISQQTVGARGGRGADALLYPKYMKASGALCDAQIREQGVEKERASIEKLIQQYRRLPGGVDFWMKSERLFLGIYGEVE